MAILPRNRWVDIAVLPSAIEDIVSRPKGTAGASGKSSAGGYQTVTPRILGLTNGLNQHFSQLRLANLTNPLVLQNLTTFAGTNLLTQTTSWPSDSTNTNTYANMYQDFSTDRFSTRAVQTTPGVYGFIYCLYTRCQYNRSGRPWYQFIRRLTLNAAGVVTAQYQYDLGSTQYRNIAVDKDVIYLAQLTGTRTTVDIFDYNAANTALVKRGTGLTISKAIEGMEVSDGTRAYFYRDETFAFAPNAYNPTRGLGGLERDIRSLESRESARLYSTCTTIFFDDTNASDKTLIIQEKTANVANGANRRQLLEYNSSGTLLRTYGPDTDAGFRWRAATLIAPTTASAPPPTPPVDPPTDPDTPGPTGPTRPVTPPPPREVPIGSRLFKVRNDGLETIGRQVTRNAAGGIIEMIEQQQVMTASIYGLPQELQAMHEWFFDYGDTRYTMESIAPADNPAVYLVTLSLSTVPTSTSMPSEDNGEEDEGGSGQGPSGGGGPSGQ